MFTVCSTFPVLSPIQSAFHTTVPYAALFLSTFHTVAAQTSGAILGFSILPNDSSECRLEKLGIGQNHFVFVDDPLISKRCPASLWCQSGGVIYKCNTEEKLQGVVPSITKCCIMCLSILNQAFMTLGWAIPYQHYTHITHQPGLL